MKILGRLPMGASTCEESQPARTQQVAVWANTGKLDLTKNWFPAALAQTLHHTMCSRPPKKRRQFRYRSHKRRPRQYRPCSSSCF